MFREESFSSLLFWMMAGGSDVGVGVDFEFESLRVLGIKGSEIFNNRDVTAKKKKK